MMEGLASLPDAAERTYSQHLVSNPRALGSAGTGQASLTDPKKKKKKKKKKTTTTMQASAANERRRILWATTTTTPVSEPEPTALLFGLFTRWPRPSGSQN